MSNYTVEIVGRGEEVRYTEGERVLYAGIGIRGSTIAFDTYTVTAWANPKDTALTESERKTVIERILAYLRTRTSTVTLNTQAPPPGPPPGTLTGRDVVEYRKRLGISTHDQNEFR